MSAFRLEDPAHWPDRPLLMGIVNVTPDSFSDGGRFFRWERAVEHGLALLREGADLLDLGAESTRPGSEPVEATKEMDRLLPVVEALAGETDAPLCVDTRKPEVAEAALDAGACWVNDVGGLREPAMASTAARHGAGVVAMHMLGEPRSMQDAPTYEDVQAEVRHFLKGAADRALAAGIPRERIWLDPGIGFGKELEHNLQLLAGLDRLSELGYPLVVGASRKRFIEALTGDPVDERLGGSLAAAGAALALPRVVLRVHDVAATRQYLTVRRSIEAGTPRAFEPTHESRTSGLHGLED